MKHILLSTLVIAFLLATSCNNYQKISYSKASVFKKKPVAEKIEEYDVYVHKDDKTYKLNEPEISEEVLTGIPVEVISEETDERDNLNDMHIFVIDDAGVELNQNQTQRFDESNVKEVEMYGKAREGLTGVGAAILIALGAVALLLVVLILSIGSSASGGGSNSGGGSDSGGSDSGGSDSGGSDSSGSDSSGSDSSGSDSGGSDSGGSGCYIATMSYGSYDAPQVLVLREFRDRFLDRFKAGRSFIAWYYRNSPSFVEKHRSKKWLHATLRVPLNVFVAFLGLFYSGRNASK